MQVRLLTFLVLLLFLDNLSVLAQNDSLAYQTELYLLNANQSFQPHWQVSNRYGIFDRSEQIEFVGLFGLSYQYNISNKFNAESEIEFNLKSNISTSYFQQLYLNLYYGSLQLKFGKEAYTIGQYSEELSSGSLFVSNNPRPPPRIGIGFYNYTPIPLIKKFVEFKGAMNFGILNDDRSTFNGTDKPFYHEKFLYIRSKSLPVNIHLGLLHSALFGGTRPNGTKIPVDFLATFFGQSSSKLGGGEEINVAGAHFGLYDVGVNFNVNQLKFQTYLQKPFSDKSGMRLHSKDLVLGILLENENGNLINSVNYEYINTTHQSGAGLPDPIVNDKLIVPSDIEDFDQFMLDNFDTITSGFTEQDFMKYIEQNLNYGHKYTGRDDHYNNYLYPMGQSFNQYALGNSLILSKSDLHLINPDEDFQYDRFFVSNRIIAHHLAFDGFFNNNFSYRTKLTYSINHGSYAGANKGRYNWGSMEDPEYYNSYYFKNGLKQAYTFFEVNFTPFKDKSAQFSSSIAYDFGEMYHNFGILFGFHYNGFLRLKNSSKSQH